MTARASRDADLIFAWLFDQSPQFARRWYEELQGSLRSLEHLPRRCAIAVESRAVGFEVRQMLHYGYRVLFRVDGRSVRVLHIRHARQRRLGKGELSPDAD